MFSLFKSKKKKSRELLDKIGEVSYVAVFNFEEEIMKKIYFETWPGWDSYDLKMKVFQNDKMDYLNEGYDSLIIYLKEILGNTEEEREDNYEIIKKHRTALLDPKELGIVVESLNEPLPMKYSLRRARQIWKRINDKSKSVTQKISELKQKWDDIVFNQTEIDQTDIVSFKDDLNSMFNELKKQNNQFKVKLRAHHGSENVGNDEKETGSLLDAIVNALTPVVVELNEELENPNNVNNEETVENINNLIKKLQDKREKSVDDFCMMNTMGLWVSHDKYKEWKKEEQIEKDIELMSQIGYEQYLKVYSYENEYENNPRKLIDIDIESVPDELGDDIDKVLDHERKTGRGLTEPLEIGDYIKKRYGDQAYDDFTNDADDFLSFGLDKRKRMGGQRMGGKKSTKKSKTLKRNAKKSKTLKRNTKKRKPKRNTKKRKVKQLKKNKSKRRR